MPEIPTWVASLPTPSPWPVVALAVVVQLPRLLPAAVEALAHLVALYSRRPARRRAAHRILEHGQAADVAEPVEAVEP